MTVLFAIIMAVQQIYDSIVDTSRRLLCETDCCSNFQAPRRIVCL